MFLPSLFFFDRFAGLKVIVAAEIGEIILQGPNN